MALDHIGERERQRHHPQEVALHPEVRRGGDENRQQQKNPTFPKP
ncbi:MAG: hypothetical protein VW338_02710 [Rhodospirillaceae bacterium]